MENRAYGQEAKTILMDDPTVTKIPVIECGESLVDLRLNPLLVIDSRLADAAGRHRFVRAGLAQRLYRAAQSLPDELRLLVVEGYRPLALQIKYFNEYVADLRKRFPGTSDREIRSLASRYVSPPDDLPPHCAGAAIDLTLVHAGGFELDMGTQINDSPEQSGGRCYFDSKEISKECTSNRAVLATALEDAGLVNYPTEWWHWSYGDRYWSFKTATKTAIYGLIDGP